MFSMSVAPLEMVIRAFTVYFFLLLILRLTGKRQIGQLAPFDLVLLLILSNAVQNSMNAGDNSLVGGLISATVLISVNWIVGYLVFHFHGVEKFVEGKPEFLVRNGTVNKKILKKEQISMNELQAVVRSHGCSEISDVDYAILEINGAIHVRTKNGN
jgi:uncharacterized membrane protein YcaP (DUF421 family)